jgi:hypothetical protein
MNRTQHNEKEDKLSNDTIFEVIATTAVALIIIALMVKIVFF